MNNLPFTFVKAIHEEKIERSLTHQRWRNDSVMPRPALMPDPIGLLFAQIHSAIDRGVARTIEVICQAMPAKQTTGRRNLPFDRKPQPLASAGAKQATIEVITEEIEQNNVNGHLSNRIYA